MLDVLDARRGRLAADRTLHADASHCEGLGDRPILRLPFILPQARQIGGSDPGERSRRIVDAVAAEHDEDRAPAHDRLRGRLQV